MTKELSINMHCVLLREGIEIWINEKKAEKLKDVLLILDENKFVDINNSLINTFSIVGVFTAEEMEDRTRRKNGQWKDNKGNWHDKGEKVCKCGNVIPYGKQCGYCA
jgi:hypothetical protein